MLSDSSAAWTGSTFFKYDGEIEDYPTDEQTQQLATLVIRDFIPQNIIDIRPQDLLKFREKYRDERQRFSSAIRDAAMVISECEDETVYNDRLEDLKKEIESSLTDYPGKHGSFEYCWVKPLAASLASLRYYQIQHRNPLIIQGKQRKITNQKG